MKKSQIMPYSIIGVVILISIFTSIMLSSISNNEKLDIEVTQIDNSLSDIKSNMQKVKRCTEISLNGYLELLIEHAGFLYENKELVTNKDLKKYYDSIDFKLKSGDYYPILTKRIDIKVPDFPYNEAGNKYNYYDIVLDSFSDDIINVIELSVEEFFPDIVRSCLNEVLDNGVANELLSDVNVTFNLDQEYYNFRSDFKLDYKDIKNTSMNYMEFEIRKQTNIYDFVHFVEDSLRRDSIITPDFNLNEDFEDLSSFKAGYDINSRYDSVGYYFYSYDSLETIDLDTAKIKFFGEDSPTFLSFYEDDKEVMRFPSTGYDFEVLPETNLTINLEAHDAQDPNDLTFLVDGFMVNNRYSLNISECIDNKINCINNPLNYVDVVSDTGLNFSKLKNGILELEFEKEDVGPQNITVYLADENYEKVGYVYEGEANDNMDYKTINLLVLDSPVIDVYIGNYLDDNYDISIEDPWVFSITGNGIFSDFIANISMNPTFLDSYHVASENEFFDNPKINMNFPIDVYRYMNGERHSFYQHFDLKLNISECTPIRKDSAEYPFNTSINYNHTSCDDNGDYMGVDNVCFSESSFFGVPFIGSVVGNLDKVYNSDFVGKMIEEDVYYNINGVNYYNLDNLNDVYTYDLEVNSSVNVGNECNGNSFYTINHDSSCDSFLGEPYSENVEIFGSCSGFSEDSCDSFSVPYETNYLTDPNFYTSFKKYGFNDIHFDLLSQGNCSYYNNNIDSSDKCNGVSCGCNNDGKCIVPELMYFDKDEDGYPDEFNSKCLCEEKDGYIKKDYTKGFDCYDDGPFAEFFNSGVKWFSLLDSSSVEYKENMLYLISSDYIFTEYNETHNLICERNSSNIDFSNINNKCSIKLK